MVLKPALRGFTVRQFKRDMIATFILSTAGVIAHRLLVVNPRRQAYADFYKYDPNQALSISKH